MDYGTQLVLTIGRYSLIAQEYEERRGVEVHTGPYFGPVSV
jgi:hypothetical protein